MARAPSFQRVEQATSLGSGQIDGGPRQPYAQRGPDPFNVAIQNLGKRIEAAGDTMVKRHSSLKLEELTLRSTRESAEFQLNLKPDDYALWPKQVEEFNKSQDAKYSKAVQDASFGLTKDDKARLSVRRKSDNQLSELTALRNSKSTERVVVPAQLERMIATIAKDVQAQGYDGMGTRLAIQNGMSAIKAQEDLLGSTAIKALQEKLLHDVEARNVQYRIMSDPNSIVDAGGLEQFSHLTGSEGLTAIRQAKTQVNNRRNNFNKETAGLEKSLGQEAASLKHVINAIDLQDPEQFDLLRGQMSAHFRNIEELANRAALDSDPNSTILEDAKRAMAGYEGTRLAIEALRSIQGSNTKAEAASVRKEFQIAMARSSKEQPGRAAAMSSFFPSLKAAVTAVGKNVDNARALDSLQLRTLAPNSPEGKAALKDSLSRLVPIEMQIELGLARSEENVSSPLPVPDPDLTRLEVINENLFKRDRKSGELSLGIGSVLLLHHADQYKDVPSETLSVLLASIKDPRDKDFDIQRGLALQQIALLLKNKEIANELYDNGLGPKERDAIDLYRSSYAAGLHHSAIGEIVRTTILPDLKSGSVLPTGFDAETITRRGADIIESISSGERHDIFAKTQNTFFENALSFLPGLELKIDATPQQFDHMSKHFNLLITQYAQSTSLDSEAIKKLATYKMSDVFASTTFNMKNLTPQKDGLPVSTGIGLSLPDHPKFQGYYGSNPMRSRQELARALLQFVNASGNEALVNDPDSDVIRYDRSAKTLLGFGSKKSEYFNVDGEGADSRWINTPENQKLLDIGDDVSLNFIGRSEDTGKPQWLILIKGEPVLDYSEEGKNQPFVYTPDYEKGVVAQKEERERILNRRKFFGPVRGLTRDLVDSVGQAVSGVRESETVMSLEDFYSPAQTNQSLTAAFQTTSDVITRFILGQDSRPISLELIPEATSVEGAGN